MGHNGRSITVSKSTANGKPCYRANVPVSLLGHRKKKYFATEYEALAWADEFEANLKEHGRVRVLSDGKTVSEVLRRFWATKSLHGHHARLARFYLDKFEAVKGNTGIELVSPFDLQKFWQSRKWGATTKAQACRYLSLFFGWAERYDFVTRNPARRVERPKASTPKKSIVTPSQMKDLLEKASPILKRFLCLGAFCGLRTSEFLSGVEVGRMEIKVLAGKTGERFVKILPPFRRHFPKGKFVPPDERTFRRHREALVKNMKWQEWPANCLRHSFASYHVAMWEDAPRTAFQMGHSSPQMVHRAYARCLVPERGGVEHEDVPIPSDLWDKYYMAAPARRRRCVGRSNIVKRA